MTIKEDFSFIQINLTSSKRIKEWGTRKLQNGQLIGEVNNTDTINYRTFKPDIYGLFCEKIFGPVKNWECSCGKNKGAKFGKLLICERCDVEITESSVRRYRMGYIKLFSPVTHIWYLKGIPSYISLLLSYRLIKIEEIVYFHRKIPQKQMDKIFIKTNFSNLFDLDNQLSTGPIALKYLIKNLNLKNELRQNRLALSLVENGFEISEVFKNLKKTLQTREKLSRRIRLLENFIATGSDPIWMILDFIPVIPPGLRPMVQLETGRFATSDLNDLYKSIIMRNNRLLQLMKMLAPLIVINNEKRLIQEAVDSLIDNGKRGRKVVDLHNRPLKSLSDYISGKYGRFRQNLLGKRVDYSARSVIIVGPNLKLNQCGLPHEIALTLFEPFLINEIMKNSLATNTHFAKKLIKQVDIVIWDILKKILQEHPIILNRAPTLHRLGIQSFEAILVPGRAIHLHPLVCTAFNADFDGDQMAIHLPLSLNAQNEAKNLMLAYNNFISSANGDAIISPTQDMVLGCYYLTINNLRINPYINNYFFSYKDVIIAYSNNLINLHTPIWVKNNKFHVFENQFSSEIQITNFTNQEYIRTTPGRILLNISILKNLHL